MPSANPVYQPTTITYGRHKEWSNNYLTDTVIPNCQQKPCLQRLLLITAVLLAIVGFALTIFALVHDANTHSDDGDDVDHVGKVAPADSDYSDYADPKETDVPDKSNKHDHQTNVILGSVGITLILLSLGLYIGFLSLRGTCRGLLRRHSRAPHLVGQLQSSDPNSIGGNPMSVSYKEVQESSSLNLDPSVPAEEERHSLMDLKGNGEDTERMMDDDPRIVLKPLRTAEEA